MAKPAGKTGRGGGVAMAAPVTTLAPLMPLPWALAACAVWLALFAALAWLAVRGKSATFDEPLHATAAWAIRHQGDYRVDPANPCLWEYWAALPQPREALKFDDRDPLWKAMPQSMAYQWPWASRSLFDTPGVDATAFIARS